MITFLNDKEDPQLRASFYENLVGVATFIGWQSSQIISPLLQQGLSDPEEFVTACCIAAMSALTELDLLLKASLLQLLRESAPFLLHPNLWVRQAAAGFLAAAAARLDPVDVLVKLGAIAAPYLQRQVRGFMSGLAMAGFAEIVFEVRVTLLYNDSLLKRVNWIL